MGVCWKRLKCSLKKATVIIEGDMSLHNFLVDYRDEHADNEINICER